MGDPRMTGIKGQEIIHRPEPLTPEVIHYTERLAERNGVIIEHHHHYAAQDQNRTAGEDLLHRIMPYFVIMGMIMVMFGMIAGILMMLLPPFLALIVVLVGSLVSMIMSLLATMIVAAVIALVIGYLTKINSKDLRRARKR